MQARVQPVPTLNQQRVPRTILWTTLAAVGFLIASLLYKLRYPLEINTDNAVYLAVAQLLLGGKQPYVDFYDTNPPLIMYLNVIPAAIGNWLGLNSIIP